MVTDINALASSLNGLQKIQSALSVQNTADITSFENIFTALLSLKPFQLEIAKANEA